MSFKTSPILQGKYQCSFCGETAINVTHWEEVEEGYSTHGLTHCKGHTYEAKRELTTSLLIPLAIKELKKAGLTK